MTHTLILSHYVRLRPTPKVIRAVSFRAMPLTVCPCPMDAMFDPIPEPPPPVIEPPASDPKQQLLALVDGLTVAQAEFLRGLLDAKILRERGRVA